MALFERRKRNEIHVRHCSIPRPRARPRSGRGAGLRQYGQDRHPERPVRRLCRFRRQVVGRGSADGGRGFRRQGAERPHRNRQRRSSEQARRRLQPRPPVVRSRQGRRDHGADDLVGRPCRPAIVQGKEEDQHRHRRRDDRSDRQSLHAVRVPLGLRQSRARRRHRRRRCRARRRHLVLHHGRLRLRPLARAAKLELRQVEGRQGRRRRAPPLERPGLLLLPAAGARVQGEDRRARQCRARHLERHQAGRRIRHRPGRPAPGRPPVHARPRCTGSGSRPLKGWF